MWDVLRNLRNRKEFQAYMLIITDEEKTLTAIPASSPKPTTLVDFTKPEALFRVSWEDVDDVVLHHSTRAQADVLARVLLTRASSGKI